MGRILWKHAKIKKWLQYFLVFILASTLSGCGAIPESADKAGNITAAGNASDAAEKDTAGENGISQPANEEESDASQPSNGEISKKTDASQTSDEEFPDKAEPTQPADDTLSPAASDEDGVPPEDGTYTSRDDVAQYIFTYGHLPSNFITKKETRTLGWEGGSLEPYAPGKCIGGSRFGNYEGLLPEKDGRVYTECDIDTLGADRRGAKRIVFSNDGLVYYTEDHYESFEFLYGEE